jgi:hypothetical protein
MVRRLTAAGWKLGRVTWAKIETGGRGIGLGEAALVADVLGVGLEDLMEGPLLVKLDAEDGQVSP